MSIDLLKLIKSNKIFASLDDTALKKIFIKSQKIYLKKNHLLFRQGDTSTHIYFLITGKLSIILKTENNNKKIINEIYPGETAGEISALSHELRSVTIKAAQDSILLQLPSNIFREIFHDHPAVLFEMMDIVVNRSHRAIEQLMKETATKKQVAIMPANTTISLKNFTEKLIAEAQAIPNLLFVTEADLKNASTTLKQTLQDIENKHETIVYLLEACETDIAQACLAKVTTLYVIADPNTPPEINTFVRNQINNKTEIIFWHQTEDYLPKNPSLWLRQTKFFLYHHIRNDHDKDYQRLLRFITGQAIGVVLGGGGLRCWAHLGAITALLEANIPIDMIGGTSAGAIVAGFYALHESLHDPKKQLQTLSEATRKTVGLRNLTWPAISLSNGKLYTHVLKQIFNNVRIENLSIPTFFVSCNLASNTEKLHRRGYLWKAIRSSTAVPAIFPPIVIKGKLHLDGGILNNLPVDSMKNFVGNKGTTIAIELTHNGHDKNKYKFPSVLPFWKTALVKLGWLPNKYKFPHFIETFLKALLAGSSAKQYKNSQAANVLISPDLSQYGLLNVTKQQEKELIKLGYDAAVTAIKNWRNKNQN